MAKKMNTCKYCKWWEPWGENYPISSCRDDGICRELGRHIFASIGDDGFLEYLETPKDFGCIHWEKKDGN